jgi:hypothetical protein
MRAEIKPEATVMGQFGKERHHGETKTIVKAINLNGVVHHGS